MDTELIPEDGYSPKRGDFVGVERRADVGGGYDIRRVLRVDRRTKKVTHVCTLHEYWDEDVKVGEWHQLTRQNVAQVLTLGKFGRDEYLVKLRGERFRFMEEMKEEVLKIGSESFLWA